MKCCVFILEALHSLIHWQGVMALAQHFDHGRDERLMNLSNIARKHPFLVLRQLPQIMRMLEEDATPRTSRPFSGSMVPFPRPSSTDFAVSTSAGGDRMNVLFSHWGSLYGAGLWKGVLDLISSMPLSVVMAHQQTIPPKEGVYGLLRLYMRLLVAQGEEAAVGNMAPMLELLAGWVDAIKRQDPGGFDASVIGKAIETLITPPKEIYKAFLQPYRQPQGLMESPPPFPVGRQPPGMMGFGGAGGGMGRGGGGF